MKKLLLTLSLFLFSVYSFAQVPPPPDYHENFTTPGSGDALPIDQYVFYLLGLAVVAGAYLMWNKRKAFN